jgi:hypothetical protein
MNTYTDALGRDLQAAFGNARDLAAKGGLPRAERLCIQILCALSDHAEALLLLGGNRTANGTLGTHGGFVSCVDT